MPDAAHDAVHEQHGEVSGAPVRHRSLGRTRKEQCPRMRAHDERVEVRQQADAGHRVFRERRVPRCDPTLRGIRFGRRVERVAVGDRHRVEAGEREHLQRALDRHREPARELRRGGRAVGVEVAPQEPQRGIVARQPLGVARVGRPGVSDLRTALRAEAQHSSVGGCRDGRTPARPEAVEGREGELSRPVADAGDNLVAEFLRSERHPGGPGLGENVGDGGDHGIRLAFAQAHALNRRGAWCEVRERGEPAPELARGGEVYGAARAEGLDERLVTPERVPDGRGRRSLRP